MNCSRCARWLQIGLAILTSSLTTAVNAATLEDYSGSIAALDMPQTVEYPDASVGEKIESESVDSSETLSEDIHGLSTVKETSAISESVESIDESSEMWPTEVFDEANAHSPKSTEFSNDLPAEALPTVQVFLPDEEAVDGVDVDRLDTDKVNIVDALPELSDIATIEPRNDSIPEEALPKTITIPPVETNLSTVSEEILVAQLIPDNTLGAESSVVTSDVTIKEDPADLIEGGAVRNSNVFHSFEEFNVNTGQRVYFANPVGIENILSRTTGANVSNIDGVLGVDGEANLFILNPNGIIFGSNSELDINGSFTASTAEKVVFADDGEFSATDPQDSALLSVSVPLGIQFNTQTTGDIANQGQLDVGQDLALSASNLNLQGQLRAGGDISLDAQETVTIRDTATDAFVVSSGDDLSIQGRDGIDILTLQHLEQTPFVSGGDLTLISDGVISTDAHFDSGGDFSTRTLLGERASFVSLYDPAITAGGAYTVGDYTGASLYVTAGGDITYGNVVIDSVAATISSESPLLLLDADGGITGTGDVSIRSGVIALGQQNNTQLDSGLLVNFLSQSDINVQSITTRGGDILLRSTSGGITSKMNLDTTDNDAGNITLVADNDITINGSLRASSLPLSDAGNGGDVSISSNIGNITVIGDVDSSSADRIFESAAGDGGGISISSGFGDITTASLKSLSLGTTAGDGGDISISSEFGDITTASLESFSLGRPSAGDGGDISISSEFGDITTASLRSSSTAFGLLSLGKPSAGDGGDISISSEFGAVTSSSLNSSSSGNSVAGDGGDISISSLGDIITSFLYASSSSGDGIAGNGGDIFIKSRSGDFVESISLDSSSSGSSAAGNGGEISISSLGNIITSFLDASSESGEGAAGNGGTISISSESGNILFRPPNPEIVILEEFGLDPFIDSSSSGLMKAGNGGAISIRSSTGSITTGSLDSSSSAESSLTDLGNPGNGGDIVISSASGEIITNGNFKSGVSGENSDGRSGGSITISSDSGKIVINAILSSRSLSGGGILGDGGNISILSNSGEIVTVGDLNSGASSRGSILGDGGDISISSRSGSITTIGNVYSGTSSFTGILGDGGRISISSESGIIITIGSLSSGSSSSIGRAGNGGAIFISSKSGDITTNEIINSSSVTITTGRSSNGGAIFISSESGAITINEDLNANSVSLPGFSESGGEIFISSESGDVEVNGDLNSFSLSNPFFIEPEISTSNGGSISILAQEGIIRGRNSEINTFSVLGQDDNDSEVNTFSILGQRNVIGEGGTVTLEAAGAISGLEVATFSSSGDSGNVQLHGFSNSLVVSDLRLTTSAQVEIPDPTIPEGVITLDLTDIGQSGNTLITSAENLTLNNVEIQSNANDRTPAGSVIIQIPGQITFIDSRIDSNANSMGNAGNLIINASIVLIDQTELSASTSATGQGGEVILNVDQLIFANNGQISASTTGSGRGGNLTVQNTDSLRIQGEGRLAVEGQGSNSGRAGDLNVIAPKVTLDHGVTLSASTDSQQGGGDININASDILTLRRNSFINAESTNPVAGNASNININAGFVIAVPDENSDIIANAIGGDGGNINIKTNQSLGFIEQENFSTNELRNNTSSDISASSRSGQPGEVTINNLAPEPNQGLLELPILTPPTTIQRGCSVATLGESSFTATGRGGLPPSPTDILSRNQPLADLGPETLDTVNNTSVDEPLIDPLEPIVEAQGFVKSADGQVVLVTQASDGTSQDGWQPSTQCSGTAATGL